MNPDPVQFIDSTGDDRDAYYWMPKCSPRASIVIVHGMGEHIMRYQHIADSHWSRICRIRIRSARPRRQYHPRCRPRRDRRRWLACAGGRHRRVCPCGATDASRAETGCAGAQHGIVRHSTGTAVRQPPVRRGCAVRPTIRTEHRIPGPAHVFGCRRDGSSCWHSAWLLDSQDLRDRCRSSPPYQSSGASRSRTHARRSTRMCKSSPSTGLKSLQDLMSGLGQTWS